MTLHALIAQLPALQVAVALLSAQTHPQAPQLFTFEFVFTSQPLLVLPSQFAKLGLHALMAQLPALQAGAALAKEQTRPQAPQWLMFVRVLASQPLPT